MHALRKRSSSSRSPDSPGAADEDSCSKVPLILHPNLYGKDLVGFLGKDFNVRVSSNISQDTMILPRSSVAILVLRQQDLFDLEGGQSTKVPKMRKTKHGMLFEGEVMHKTLEGAAVPDGDDDDMASAFARVKTFAGQHANPVIIAMGTSFGEEELSVLSLLQMRLLPRPPLLLVAHGEAQLALHVMGLSKKARKELRAELLRRESKLQTKILHQDASSLLARAIMLPQQDAALLLDTFGSISDIAHLTTAQQEIELPSIASTILAFFEKDTFTL